MPTSSAPFRWLPAPSDVGVEPCWVEDAIAAGIDTAPRRVKSAIEARVKSRGFTE